MDYIKRLKDLMLQENMAYAQVDACVSYAEKLLKSNLPVIFDVNHLNIILKMNNIVQDSYSSFYISGKGKARLIEAPSRRMKMRQKWILKNILEKCPVSENAHGFIKERSIVSNAGCHVGREYILNMDICDFFPSIDKLRVEKVFRSLGYTTKVSQKLAGLCCYKDALPQGAPTSPYLANIICRQMDREIQDVAFENDAVYTRYADDVTLSSDCDLSEVIPKIEAIFEKHGFAANKEKTRLVSGNKRKLVTGLLVNTEVKVPKSFKRKLKQEIYYCQKFGVSAHLENTEAKKTVNFREYLYGKAYYIKMVEPGQGNYFLAELDKIEW